MAHLTNFSFDFFMIFDRRCLSTSSRSIDHGAKKSKMAKNSNQGEGTALSTSLGSKRCKVTFPGAPKLVNG